MSGIIRNQHFAYAKRKAMISFLITAKLISAFVFVTYIVQSHFFLNLKLQASSLILLQHRPIGVRPCRKHRRPVFWHRGSYDIDFSEHKFSSAGREDVDVLMLGDGKILISLFELCHEKTNNVVSEQLDTNRAVQAQKMVRGCKFWI